MTTRRRAMRHRAVARTCAMVSRIESFVIDRARDDDRDVAGRLSGAARAATEDASTAVRDDDGDDDDSNAKPSNEESFGRARCAL